MESRIGVSVLILTRDEEGQIARCLESCMFSDDIVVLDSGSRDGTADVVARFGNVRFIARHWDSETGQRNFGIQSIDYKYNWLYVCDADEVVSRELASELLEFVAQSIDYPGVAGGRVRYRNYLWGRWLKRSTHYPVWVTRLIRLGGVTYEARETNIHPVVDGTTVDLREHFLHFSFSKGHESWWRKHLAYSSLEARAATRVLEGGLVEQLRNDLREMGARRAAKNLSFRLPLRAWCRFVYDYVFRRGAFDGRIGFVYCIGVALYEGWISAQLDTDECASASDLIESAIDRGVCEAQSQEMARGSVMLLAVQLVISQLKFIPRAITKRGRMAALLDATRIAVGQVQLIERAQLTPDRPLGSGDRAE